MSAVGRVDLAELLGALLLDGLKTLGGAGGEVTCYVGSDGDGCEVEAESFHGGVPLDFLSMAHRPGDVK